MPTIRDPNRHIYIREWSGGILSGCFEVDGRPCFQDGVPQSFEFQLLPEDWDHIRMIILVLVCYYDDKMYLYLVKFDLGPVVFSL